MASGIGCPGGCPIALPLGRCCRGAGGAVLPLALALGACLPPVAVPRPRAPLPSGVSIVRRTPLPQVRAPRVAAVAPSPRCSTLLAPSGAAILSCAPDCRPLGVHDGGSPDGTAPTSGARVPPVPCPAETSVRMLHRRARGSSHIGVKALLHAILWWRHLSWSLTQAVSYARLTLVTWSSWLCVARTSPGRSCAFQKDSSRVSTCVPRLRCCRAFLATSRWHGEMQFQVRVLRTWFQPSVSAAVLLSCSEMVADAIASSARLVLFCLLNHVRCRSTDMRWPGGIGVPLPSGSALLRADVSVPGAGSVGLPSPTWVPGGRTLIAAPAGAARASLMGAGSDTLGV